MWKWVEEVGGAPYIYGMYQYVRQPLQYGGQQILAAIEVQFDDASCYFL